MTEYDFVNQTAWTSFFLGDKPLDHSHKLARHRWWINPTNDSSLRLSREGYDVISKRNDIKSYTHDLQKKILPKTLLQLERTITQPYFIKNLQTLILFDQKNSVILTLYGNDLQAYLDNVEKHR